MFSIVAESRATCAHPAGRTRIKEPACPERHSTTTTPTTPAAAAPLNAALGASAIQLEQRRRPGRCARSRNHEEEDNMEHQSFMVVPARARHQHEYDESQFLMNHLMAAAAGSDPDPDSLDPACGAGSGRNKRRFTEAQVRSLETTFHARRAARLEPREKAELARELGLQPRQVAIWFQNKRARWRSKQLEHDYAALRSQYDALSARVDALRHEKLALAAQVDELRGRLSERQDQSGSSCEANDEKAADDKRNNSGVVSSLLVVQEPRDDDGATPPAAVVDASEQESAATEYFDAYGGGGLLHDSSFCATPDLWDTWPLLAEWNAVA